MDKRLFTVILTASIGSIYWVGTQYTSGIDNFGNEINLNYFLFFYLISFVIGFLKFEYQRLLLVTGVFVLSQPICFIFCPNVEGILENDFFISMLLLTASVLPAFILSYLARFFKLKLFK